MNKLIFKVTGPEKSNIAPLIKELTKFKCKIKLDIEHGFVTVENVNDNDIDMVIDLIDNYYVLLGVEIDNIISSANSTDDVSGELSVTESHISNNQEFNSDLPSIDVPQAQLAEPEITEPNEEVVKIYRFPNASVSASLNKLVQTSYWATFKQEENEKKINEFIWTCIREMSMQFSPTPIVKFKFGDIVECYIGRHLAKELNGSYVLGIVANISDDNLVYIIPLTKMTDFIAADSHIPFSVPNDIRFTDYDLTCGTVIFDMAKYIRAERIQRVVGKISSSFMETVLEKLLSTFDFRSNLNLLNSNIESDLSSDNGEIVLGKLVESAISNLNPKEPVSINAKRFLTEINMDTSDKLLMQAFMASHSVSKITYESICCYLKDNTNNQLSENQMANSLKNTFKNWASTKQELDNYPRLAFTSLLKLFAKALEKNS